MAPTWINIIDSDDEKNQPPQHPTASNPALIDLTLDDDTPEPGGNAVHAATTPEARFSGKASQSLPIQDKPPSSKSTPNKTLQQWRKILKNSSGPALPPPPTKFEPPSASKTGKEATQTLPSQIGRAQSVPQTDGLVEDNAEEDEKDVQSFGGPDTASKQSSRSRPSSQKSLDKSVGTDSPLAKRHKEKESELNRGNARVQRDESPRAVMARRSLSTDQPSNPHQLDVVELEDSLHRFEQKVLDDHAETVRWFLHDAKRAAEAIKSAFMDETSPFASMEPITTLPAAAPEGMTKLKLDTYVNKKKLAKGRTYVLTTTVASNVPRVPKYSSHTIVKRNILCGDDEQLKFIPFLGDQGGHVKPSVFSRLVKELDEAYTAKRSGSTKESEWASKLRTYLDGWLRELDIGCDQQALIRYILEEDSDDLGKSDKEIRLLRRAFGGPLAPNLAEVAVTFSEAFLNVFGVSLKVVILPDERLKEMLEKAEKMASDNSLGRSQSESPRGQVNGAEHTTERLGTFTNLTCLICGAICCQTHGDYNSLPLRVHNSDDAEMNDHGDEPAAEYQYTHQPIGMHYNEILRKQDVRLSKLPSAMDLPDLDSVEPPCSDECYRTFDYQDKTAELAREDIIALKSFVISMRPKYGQPCHISFLLDVPCWKVYTKIQEMKDGVPNIPPEQPLLGRSKGIDWYDNKRKTLKNDWQEQTTAHLHQERTQANPCGHEGPCNGNCPCASSNILCETFCGCPDDCPRKFTGCNCHGTGLLCVSDTCICIAMNRECGPQCTPCGAIPRINPRNKYDDDLFTRGCQNIVLQRGVNRKLMIGESQLEGTGFGLYLGEPVQKGEYLSEYAGEVISGAEADRRGIIYDRKYLSFLFDLNSEWCIDAMRLGNKTRFINHADNEKDGLNCEAKVFLVNGEHRIKFVALRDIAAGEELLFNYGKKFAEKHGLSKKLPKAKEGGKKGVVVGEEALEALDGNRARGRMTAIRGGHRGGRGGRKATKSATVRPMRELVAEVVEEEALYDVEHDEDDDDDDGEIVDDGRKKRRIKRPKRYTR